jgi:hypothetical protein
MSDLKRSAKMKKTTVFILGLAIGSLASVFAISVIRMPAEHIAKAKDIPIIGGILPDSVSAETAKEIALEVIRATNHGSTAIHNSIGDHAGNIRSILTSYDYRMRHLMLSDAVSEEVRVCYALHSIDYSYMRAEWNVKRYMLAARLIQIQKEASKAKKMEPNQAPETTILTVTDRAPSSTLRASEDRVSP